jgi:hypothetical protein
MSKPVTTVYDRVDLDFYRQQTELSSPGRFEPLFDDLPADIRELCALVQNILIHQFWIMDEGNYGVTPDALKAAGRDPNAEINLRSTEEILERLLQIDDRPLAAPRTPNHKVVGNCRDYSLLLVAMLRHQAIPARVRSGVARYFYPAEGNLEDHLICEFWVPGESRWRQADAQIDALQRNVLGFAMDATDLPPDQFLNAGEAYYELKEGRVAPEKIGIFEWKGERYVLGKLVQDLACVSGVEVLPWEGWGICGDIDKMTLSPEDHALLEDVADILVGISTDFGQFPRAHELFRTHPRLKLPADYEPYRFELYPSG